MMHDFQKHESGGNATYLINLTEYRMIYSKSVSLEIK